MTILIFSSFLIPAYAADAPSSLPGGYSQISVTDDNVTKAAAFAVQNMQKGTLGRIISAESQVVAGINYKMQLELIDADGNPHQYNVVVFMPLPYLNQPMQLTSVAEVVDNSNKLR